MNPPQNFQGPYVVNLILYVQCDQKVTHFFFAYEVKILEFRKSEATCNHKTFDFTYWGTFSAPNSEVFVQTDFFLIFKNGLAFLKIFLVKILQDHNDTKKY